MSSSILLDLSVDVSVLRGIARNVSEDPSDFDSHLGLVPGFSSHGLRYLVHYTCKAMEPVGYLEVGVFYGATFGMAMWKKKGAFVGVDSFQEFQSLHLTEPNENRFYVNVRDQRKSVLSVMGAFGEGQAVFYEMPQETMSVELVKEKTGGVNVFFYDGEHSTDATAKGIERFAPAFSDTVVLLVDDYESGEVKAGVQWGLSRISKQYRVDEELVYKGNTEVYMGLLKKEEVE